MSFKKIIIGISLPLFLSSLLLSQSVVELAKKEKERREKLKGKKVVVITNADLTKLKKRPAISIIRPVLAKEKSEKEAASTEKSPAEKAIPGGSDVVDKKKTDELTTQLQEKWNKAKEYVSLLTMKINGLWQEFYSNDNMTSKDTVQREMSETSIKLQKAKEDEAKARKELEELLAKIKKKSRI